MTFRGIAPGLLPCSQQGVHQPNLERSKSIERPEYHHHIRKSLRESCDEVNDCEHNGKIVASDQLQIGKGIDLLEDEFGLCLDWFRQDEEEEKNWDEKKKKKEVLKASFFKC